MFKALFALLLLLAYQPLSAQDNAAVLHWVTTEGLVGSYDPANQTFSEQPLPFAVNSNGVQWLDGGDIFVHELDATKLQIVDAETGSVMCALTDLAIDDWQLSPAQPHSLVLFQTLPNDSVSITHLDWETCTQTELTSVEGELQTPALNQDTPLLAFSTTAPANVYLLDLESGTLNQLDIDAPTDMTLAWTQDSNYLLIQNAERSYLFDRITGHISTLNSKARYLWPVANTPLLMKSGALTGTPTQFWTFENGQLGDILFEIADEVYDHQAGFSPDARYYAYTRASVPDETRVFEWQSGTSSVVANVGDLRRWSPDSRWLALMRHDPTEIRLYEMQTGNEQVYTGRFDWYGDDLWSPDSQQIAFWQMNEGEEQLIVANISDGSISKLLTKALLDYPGSVRWSPDGRHLYVEMVETQADGTLAGCHSVVEIATAVTHKLGCGIWNVRWAG